MSKLHAGQTSKPESDFLSFIPIVLDVVVVCSVLSFFVLYFVLYTSTLWMYTNSCLNNTFNGFIKEYELYACSLNIILFS